MILVYRQRRTDNYSKHCYFHKKNNDATQAVSEAIKEGKLIPGDLATTIHVADTHLHVDLQRTVKHYGVFVRGSEIEAVADTVGIMMLPTSYKYHREWMKRGRIKSAWFTLIKKRE